MSYGGVHNEVALETGDAHASSVLGWSLLISSERIVPVSVTSLLAFECLFEYLKTLARLPKRHMVTNLPV